MNLSKNLKEFGKAWLRTVAAITIALAGAVVAGLIGILPPIVYCVVTGSQLVDLMDPTKSSAPWWLSLISLLWMIALLTVVLALDEFEAVAGDGND